MNNKKIFLSLIPWVLFSVMIGRRGAQAAGYGALIAGVLALWFATTNADSGRVKLIDATGVVTFGAMAAGAFAGGSRVTDWIADYGRGGSALVLALVMLGSTVVVPFTEQYARESVPRQYWTSPVFRSVNRRISAFWGAVIFVMACCHLLAGYLDPATSPQAGARPVDLLLNWVIPVLLILLGIHYTQQTSEAAGTTADRR